MRSRHSYLRTSNFGIRIRPVKPGHWLGYQPKRLAEKSLLNQGLALRIGQGWLNVESYKICQYQLVSSQLWIQYSGSQHQKHSINNYSSEYFQTNWKHLQVKLGQPNLPDCKWQENSLTFSNTKSRNQGQFNYSLIDLDLQTMLLKSRHLFEQELVFYMNGPKGWAGPSNRLYWEDQVLRQEKKKD